MKMFTDFYHTVKELPPDIIFHYISDTFLILYERAVFPTTMKMFTDFYHTVKELPPDIIFHYISDTFLILYERAVFPTTMITKLKNL